ncbi:hypothetical protein PS2_021274 [Malus domestica]
MEGLLAWAADIVRGGGGQDNKGTSLIIISTCMATASSLPPPENLSFTSTASFTPDADDISPIVSVRDFFREFFKEAKKLWFLTGPAIFTFICQYSLSTIT